jgi:hypothetical protein
VRERTADLGGEGDGRVDADEVEDEIRTLVPSDVALAEASSDATT